MEIDSLKKDPGFLRLFFQAIFDIVIKPIQGAWSHREKTIHGYVAAILAIGIFLYFLVAGLYGSLNFFYGMFYEDQFNKNLQQSSKEALDELFLDSCNAGIHYIHSEKIGNNSGALFSSGKGSKYCKSSVGGMFFPISTPIRSDKENYSISFIRKDKYEKNFYFFNVTLKKDGWFSYKLYDIIQVGATVDKEGFIVPLNNVQIYSLLK